MGNFYSSLSEEAKQFKELTKEQDPQTPVTTPNASPSDEENNVKLLKIKGGFIDPRSPTQGVSRTPLEIEERNRRIEKTRINNLFNKENNSLNLPPTDGSSDTVTTPTGVPGKDALFFDPRSPNPEINRTPIALNSNTAPIARKMFQNQNQ